MSYKLYSFTSQSSAGFKVEVLLRFLDIKVEFVNLPFDQWQSPEYLQKHPLGKIPTL